jgi:hypothetical protein
MSGQRLAPVSTLLCAALAACGGGSAARSRTGAVIAAPATARVAGCPVTVPNGRTPPGEQPSREDHGSGGLWTVIPPDGRIVAARAFVLPDGSMRIKFPWWGSRRADAHLQLGTSSLHRRGGIAGAQISPGQTGAPHFWASAIVFPTEGCWRVTASAGHARLSLVVFLVKGPA